MSLAVIMPQVRHHAIADDKQHRHQTDGHRSQQGIEQKHDHAHSHDICHIDEEIRNTVYKKGRYLLRIVGNSGHQAARLPSGIKADGKPAHGSENLTFQFAYHLRSDLGGQGALKHPQTLHQHLDHHHGDYQESQCRGKTSCRKVKTVQNSRIANQNLVVKNGSA